MSRVKFSNESKAMREDLKKFYATITEEAKITLAIKAEKTTFLNSLVAIASKLEIDTTDMTTDEIINNEVIKADADYPAIRVSYDEKIEALKAKKSENNKKQKELVNGIVSDNVYYAYMGGLEKWDFSAPVGDYTLKEGDTTMTERNVLPLCEYMYGIFKALGGSCLSDPAMKEAANQFASHIGAKMLKAAEIVEKGHFVGAYKKNAFKKAAVLVLCEMLVHKYNLFEIKGNKLVTVIK